MFWRVFQVVPARGQWDPYYRWKPHHNCKINGLKKHYDPARLQREAAEKDQEEAKGLEIEKALEIAAAMSDATAASFIGAIAGLALTPTTRRRIIDDYEGTSEAFPNENWSSFKHTRISVMGILTPLKVDIL